MSRPLSPPTPRDDGAIRRQAEEICRECGLSYGALFDSLTRGVADLAFWMPDLDDDDEPSVAYRRRAELAVGQIRANYEELKAHFGLDPNQSDEQQLTNLAPLVEALREGLADPHRGAPWAKDLLDNNEHSIAGQLLNTGQLADDLLYGAASSLYKACSRLGSESSVSGWFGRVMDRILGEEDDPYVATRHNWMSWYQLTVLCHVYAATADITGLLARELGGVALRLHDSWPA